MTDPVIRDAIRLRDRLQDIAKERDLDAQLPTGIRRATTDATRELAEMEANSCRAAAKMLQRLGTEVDRLRQLIGCYQHGRLPRSSLYRAAENWNGDPREGEGEQP